MQAKKMASRHGSIMEECLFGQNWGKHICKDKKRSKKQNKNNLQEQFGKITKVVWTSCWLLNRPKLTRVICIFVLRAKCHEAARSNYQVSHLVVAVFISVSFVGCRGHFFRPNHLRIASSKKMFPFNF